MIIEINEVFSLKLSGFLTMRFRATIPASNFQSSGSPSSILARALPLELVADFFRIVIARSSPHRALLSIARRESPGWDWLCAPLIRAGAIYPMSIADISAYLANDTRFVLAARSCLPGSFRLLVLRKRSEDKAETGGINDRSRAKGCDVPSQRVSFSWRINWRVLRRAWSQSAYS